VKDKTKDFLKNLGCLTPVLVVAILIILVMVLGSPIQKENYDAIKSESEEVVNDMRIYFPNTTFIPFENVTLGTVKIKVAYSEFVEITPNPNFVIYNVYITGKTGLGNALNFQARISFFLLKDGVVYYTTTSISQD